MFTKVDCVILTCDNCQDHFENSDGFAIFADQDSAKDDAQNDDWHIDGEKHYCPDCYKIDDDDNMIIDKNRTKPLEPDSENFTHPCIDPLREIKGCDMPKGSCAACGG